MPQEPTPSPPPLPTRPGEPGGENPFCTAETAAPGAVGVPDPDADIVAEREEYERLRREPGLFKARGKAPGLLVTAWRTPGELAVLALFIAGYGLLLGLTLVVAGEPVRRLPGLAQCVVLAVLLWPAAGFAGRCWRLLGPRGREAVRWAVRLWPVTLAAAACGLGLLARLWRG